MTKMVVTVAAAAALAQPVLSAAGDKWGDTPAAPTSFVPHPHTSHHVYGAPIGPAIVGHRKTSHHGHSTKKRSSSPISTT